MEIINISRKSLNQAAALMKKGGVVVYPTDTAYALGADSWRVSALQKIYKIKGRVKNKPLPMIAASRSMVLNFFRVSKPEQALMKKYWPGPVSVILELRSKNYELWDKCLYSNVLKNIGISVAVRVPKNKVARELSRRLGRPIISTSANISGYGECYSAKEISRQFKNRQYQPDLILAAGKLPKRQPSTIIKVQNDEVEVLRPGPVSIEVRSKD